MLRKRKKKLLAIMRFKNHLWAAGDRLAAKSAHCASLTSFSSIPGSHIKSPMQPSALMVGDTGGRHRRICRKLTSNLTVAATRETLPQQGGSRVL